jgi:hypothetical protein
MTEQVLAIFETHAARPKPSAKGVFQVVNSNQWQIRPITSVNPAGFEHPVNWLSSK